MSALVALVAAAVFGIAVAVQQHEAARAEVKATLRPGLLMRLARRPIWLLGLVGDIGGFGLQTWALAIGSVVVVQPVMSTNLVFALVGSALLARRRLRRRQLCAIAGTVGGLVVFLVVASPTAHSEASASGWAWVALACLASGLVAAALWTGWHAPGPRQAAAFGVAAGLAEACMAVIAKSFGDDLARGIGVTARSWTPEALVGVGLVTLLLVQTAYQVGLPVVTLPVTAVVEPVAAAAFGVTLFRERLALSGLRGPCVLLAAVVMGTSLVALARGGFEAEQPRPAEEAAT